MSKKLTPLPGFTDPRGLAGAPADATVAVALSGGADSVALLALLADTPIHAVHVHHGIRGAEADRDAAFCRELAASFSVPFTLLQVDVPALAAARGVGLETAARDARYRAMADFMKSEGIALLATAHHAGDQLETMLQNLLRGSGTRGLCGIPACRPLGDGLFVVRPLLHLTKDDLLSYLAENGLSYVTDSTNKEPFCRRNILRQEVLPLLEELQPGAALAAARCAEALAEDEAYFDGLAADFLEREGSAPAVSALAALPAPVFARVMRRFLPTVPAACHMDALRRLVQSPRPHASLSLPGARVEILQDRLILSPLPSGEQADYTVTLLPGKNPIPAADALIYVHTGAEETLPLPTEPDYLHHVRMLLGTSAVKGTLSARPRRAGDRILQGGMHKVVRRLACLSRFTLAERAKLPLILDDDGILAVPFGPVRDHKKEKINTVIDVFFSKRCL